MPCGLQDTHQASTPATLELALPPNIWQDTGNP